LIREGARRDYYRHTTEASMPRYEFVEGTSSKFWEITLDGSSFQTKYGRIGTPGAVTLKEYDSPEKAKKEYEKLIAEKVKKGYQPVGGGAAAPAPKAAPKPKAEKKPAAKPAAAPAASGDWLRYEFSEGTSNKFWEIKLEGSAFQTKYGRIGTPGAVTLKEFDSPEKAKKEYDKLVAEKVKKGYQKA
jgi:predicted DNA-binding WGR domain protein